MSQGKRCRLEHQITYLRHGGDRCRRVEHLWRERGKGVGPRREAGPGRVTLLPLTEVTSLPYPCLFFVGERTQVIFSPANRVWKSAGTGQRQPWEPRKQRAGDRGNQKIMNQEGRCSESIGRRERVSDFVTVMRD